MGNREDLLDGAKRCLFEKGFARTTARDIATASGVSLAAIGYHFGSKEALLDEALQLAIKDWGDELAALLAGSTDFAAAWTTVLESFTDSRPLWAIQFERLAQLGHDPALRKSLAAGNREARLGLAELLRGIDPAATDANPAKLGAFYQVMLVGLAAVWLSDEAGAPSGEDLLQVMRTLTG
jgi:AcrR family transcriptional regulator